MRGYLWDISMRYLMARRRSMLSLVTVISVVGVALGVAVLIFVLSVLGGFASDLREKILGTKAHVVISADHGALTGAEAIMASARQHPEVVGASAYVESRVLVSSATNVEGVVLRGVDPASVGQTSALVDNIVDGDLEWLHDPSLADDYLLRDVPPRYLELEEEARRLHDELELLQQSLDDTAEMRRRYEAQRTARLGSGRGTGEGTEEGRGLTGVLGGRRPGSGEGTGLVALPPREGTGAARPRFVMPLLPGQGPIREPEPAPASGEPAQATVLAAPVPMPPLAATPRRHAPGIVIGTQLAEALHVAVGDELTIISPDGQLLPTGPAPLSRPFTVVALFYSGLYEFDRRFAYTLTDEARDLFRMAAGEVTAVDVKVRNLERASSVATDLTRALDDAGLGGLLVRSWEELNQSLFSALELEKFALFIILTIIILVASFSIASSLVVMVIERSQEIGILKSMGASNREIMGIFAIAGGVIGAIGTALGVLVGVGLCVALQTYGWPLDTEVYYIEYLPVHLEPVEVVLTALAGMVISLGSTVYPAVKAARLSPAEALRND